MSDWISVSSSNIQKIKYHPKSQTLEIMFNDGSIYQYFDVPLHIFEGLRTPPGGSHGQYFNANIKGVYRYARL